MRLAKAVEGCGERVVGGLRWRARGRVPRLGDSGCSRRPARVPGDRLFQGNGILGVDDRVRLAGAGSGPRQNSTGRANSGRVAAGRGARRNENRRNRRRRVRLVGASGGHRSLRGGSGDRCGRPRLPARRPSRAFRRSSATGGHRVLGTSSAASAATSSSATGTTVRMTFVPQPDGSIRTVPRARSPSQATAVSGSSLVIRISPNWSRWRASEAASLHSAHNSGGDLTSVRLATCSVMAGGFARAGATPACRRVATRDLHNATFQSPRRRRDHISMVTMPMWSRAGAGVRNAALCR